MRLPARHPSAGTRVTRETAVLLPEVTSDVFFLETGQIISVPSISSAEQLGSLTVVPGEVTVTVPSIVSGEQFGAAELEHQVASSQTVTVPSIDSSEALGALVVVPGEVIVTLSSIVSAEEFPVPVLAQSGGPQTVTLGSISSEEAFGALEFILGGEPQTITVPSVTSGESFGGLVVEQIAPDTGIAIPSITSAEQFGIASLILASEPIYLPPPGPNDPPGANTWEAWLSGTPAYISRNGFELFITGLWVPGETSFVSYGRIANPFGTKVIIPKNDSRRASTNVHLDDPIISQIKPYTRMLRVYYRGRLIYWGVLSLPEYNLEDNSVSLNTVDPSIRLYRHFIRFGDLLNKPGQLVGSPVDTGLDTDGKGLVYVSTGGLRILRDCGMNIPDQNARGVPDLGIVNGINTWDLDPEDSDGYPDFIEVARGDRVLDKMKDVSTQVTGPDFEFEPVDGQIGAYCRLNVFGKQGTDKTGQVAFHYGTGSDNLENIGITYGEEFVTHAHTLDRGAKYRYTEANLTSSEEAGIYVYWDATDYDVSKLTAAQRERVLRASGQGILQVFGRPLESYSLTCKIETDTSPWYMRDYSMGDTIKIGGVKNNFRFEDNVSITSITLEQVDDSNNIRPSLEVVPTIPTTDVQTESAD